MEEQVSLWTDQTVWNQNAAWVPQRGTNAATTEGDPWHRTIFSGVQKQCHGQQYRKVALTPNSTRSYIPLSTTTKISARTELTLYSETFWIPIVIWVWGVCLKMTQDRLSALNCIVSPVQIFIYLAWELEKREEYREIGGKTWLYVTPVLKVQRCRSLNYFCIVL